LYAEEAGNGVDVWVGTSVGVGEGVVPGSGVDVGLTICPAPQPDNNKLVTKKRRVAKFAFMGRSLLYPGLTIQIIV
jgi:hypothetical protein